MQIFQVRPWNLADYAAFVKTVLQRYASVGVHAYEIWNEPNISAFWSPRPDPERYAHLLKLAYVAVKSADPQSAEGAQRRPLAPHGSSRADRRRRGSNLAAPSSSACTPQAPRITSMRLAGTRTTSRTDSASRSGAPGRRWRGPAPSARSILRAHGDGGKKIWASEFGFPTGNTSRDVSEAKQAQLLKQVLERAGPPLVGRSGVRLQLPRQGYQRAERRTELRRRPLRLLAEACLPGVPASRRDDRLADSRSSHSSNGQSGLLLPP